MLKYLNTRKANFNGGKQNLKYPSDKGSCINASSGSIDISDNLIVDVNGKSSCFTAGGNSGGLHSQMDLVKSKVIQLNKSAEFGSQPQQQNRVYSIQGQSPSLLAGMSGGTYAVLVNEPKCAAMRGRNPENPKSRESGINTEQMIEERSDSKTNCLTSVQKDNLIIIPEHYRIRRLTPTECERLQTAKDGYTEGVSDTQRYRMLGNGWTVEVIKHIFSYYE
jgi:site-specific DNA-cytosine methylase